jgi:hypothetical protein
VVVHPPAIERLACLRAAVDGLDAEKISRMMRAVGWTWRGNPGSPTPQEIREMAWNIGMGMEGDGQRATAGLVVKQHSGHWHVSFRITEWSCWDSADGDERHPDE